MRVYSICGAATLTILSVIAVPAGAQQAEPATPEAIRAEVARLRQEFDALEKQYGDRLTALDARLTALEGGKTGTSETPRVADAAPAAPTPEAGQPGQTTPPTATVPPGAEGAGGPTGSLPVYGNASLMSKIFNPDIAVIGDFLGAAGTNRVEPLPAFEMHETEASFQAIVDPYARADFFIAFGPEGAEVEEGFITFPTVPGGLNVKVGQMRGAFGKVNTMHNHVLPWTDRPLVSQNLVGGEEGISDAGISAARLIPNPWLFLEAIGEVFAGTSEVFTSFERSDLTYVGRVRGYQDITEATNLELGTSIAYGTNEAGADFSTTLYGVDATFRYRPLRRAIYRRLLARTELIWSRRQDPTSPTHAFGAYVEGDYQFARRWFAGVRFDYSERALDASLEDKGGSVLLTYWPSEFSQIRGQYRRTRYAEGSTANELLFQFLFSIGAHGAHAF